MNFIHNFNDVPHLQYRRKVQIVITLEKLILINESSSKLYQSTFLLRHFLRKTKDLRCWFLTKPVVVKRVHFELMWKEKTFIYSSP